jgi:hypothetical protein
MFDDSALARFAGGGGGEARLLFGGPTEQSLSLPCLKSPSDSSSYVYEVSDGSRLGGGIGGGVASRGSTKSGTTGRVRG